MATGFTGWVFMLRGIGFKASVRPQGCDLDRLMGARLEGSETQGNRLPPSYLSSSSSYFSSHHVCTYEVFPSCRIADDAEAGDGDGMSVSIKIVVACRGSVAIHIQEGETETVCHVPAC